MQFLRACGALYYRSIPWYSAAGDFLTYPLLDHFTFKIALLEVQNAKISRLRRALYRDIAWYSAAGEFF